jgi:AraC-like DNA-binding protein
MTVAMASATVASVTVWDVDPSPASRTVATEGQDFMVAVPGAAGEVVRTGRGSDRAVVTGFELGAVQLAVIEVGFPAAAEAAGTGDGLILCTMLRTPDEGRWDGVDLAPGQTFVYPAGSTHHALDPAGLRFVLTVLPRDVVESSAACLGVDPDVIGDRHVVAGGSLAELCAQFADGDVFDVPGSLAADHLVDAAMHTVCTGAEVKRSRPGGRWRDSDLVEAAIAYLERSGHWMVPMLTLCRQVQASERRLQIAFRNMVGIGPNAYMRYRALQSVHRCLRVGGPSGESVADIARGHEFRHLGRFSRYYLDAYGESPSTTLRRRS